MPDTSDRDRINQKRRERYAANKEHREQIKQRNREYHAANKTRIAQYKQEWAEANREHVQKRRKRHYEANKERYKLYLVTRTYNISAEEWEHLFNQQRGLCAICCNPLDRGRDTHVDHDHITNKVRGLLCPKCNLALGLLEDDPDRILRAYEYISQAGKGGTT